MKFLTLPAFMFLASVMAMAPSCLGKGVPKSGASQSGEPPMQQHLDKSKDMSSASKHAASTSSIATPPKQPAATGGVSATLEAATEQFNSEARSIEQNPGKLAAMQEQLNEESERSAAQLSNDQAAAAMASSKDDLWSGLGLSLGKPDRSGIPVQNVRPNSPAALAGLRTGDVITKLDGTEVHSPADLRTPIEDNAPKKQIHLQARRHGIELSLSIRTDQSEPPSKQAQADGGLLLSR